MQEEKALTEQNIKGEGLSRRQIQINLKLREIAQDFFQRESSGLSLITVTRAEVSPDLRNATIFLTVLPESKEASALDFARRQRTDLRTAIKKKLPIKTIPFVEIEIDFGEKNRQHIDELLLQDKVRRIEDGAGK
jgi:ribosome-binding factor A